MEILRWMTGNPVCVTPLDTLAVARTRMENGKFRRLPVIEQGRLVGIISERDLRQHQGYLECTRVDAAMTPAPITISPNTTAEDAARLMLQHKIGGLPVVQYGQLVGIVTASDLLRALLGAVRATEHLMDH